jgi:hypothetical protein
MSGGYFFEKCKLPIAICVHMCYYNISKRKYKTGRAKKMNYDFNTKELKAYKGYGIDKAWRVDSDGERIKKYGYFYLVNDGDDYVGEEYATLADAKKAIDGWT